MKLKFIKKSIAALISCALLFVSVPHMNTFAELKDIEYLGGPYDGLLAAKTEYLEDHPDDHTEYECHHLISRQALNRWGAYICTKSGANRYNYFLTSDEWQAWAPAITMEKADHERTLSHISNTDCGQYIDEQAERLIYDGDIMGVLNDEISFIQRTFGHKYDRAINEVQQYISSLHCRHIKRTTLIMINPENKHWYFEYHFA